MSLWNGIWQASFTMTGQCPFWNGIWQALFTMTGQCPFRNGIWQALFTMTGALPRLGGQVRSYCMNDIHALVIATNDINKPLWHLDGLDEMATCYWERHSPLLWCHQGCIVLTLLWQANFIFEPVSMVSEQKTTKLICFHCTTPLVLNMNLFP